MKSRILVVEDTDDSLTIVRDVLELGGFTIFEAKDGLAAVEMALEHQPDLILMDLQLPHLDGYEAIRKIRDAGASMPIVAVTAYALPSDEATAKSAGCTEYMVKPYSPRNLLGVVIRLLEEDN